MIKNKIFFSATDGCSDGYTITLGSNGQQFQSDTAGNYAKICIDENSQPVYKHETRQIYMFTMQAGTYIHIYLLLNMAFWFIADGKDYWFVSPNVGGDFYLLAFSGDTNCPDFVTGVFVKTGPNEQDLVQDADIKITSL